MQLQAGRYTTIKSNGTGGADLGAVQRSLGDAKKSFTEIENTCVNRVLLAAEVIVSTCIGAGSETLRRLTGKEDIRFSTVLVDEAAQCMESATLPTLVHGCERLILIGDQNQLPPVVASPSVGSINIDCLYCITIDCDISSHTLLYHTTAYHVTHHIISYTLLCHRHWNMVSVSVYSLV